MILLLHALVLLSAFLLFQIELISAKLLLPGYGGSFLTFGACLVFYQATLLAGYVWAHLVVIRSKPSKYLIIHFLLLLVPFLFFPGRMLRFDPANTNFPLAVSVFWQLLITVGPAFFMLSTMTVMVSCLARDFPNPKPANHYFFYATSNAGSFLALLTYPFIFEFLMTNTAQLQLWRILYLLLVILHIPLLLRLKNTQGTDGRTAAPFALPKETILRWLALAGAPVMLFMAVNNILTYEIVPVPLLWILPMGLYLFSFVPAFSERPKYLDWTRGYTVFFILLSIFLFFILQNITFMLSFIGILLLLSLFALCYICHRELYESRPAEQNLSFFYVVLAAGGFLGGFLATWIIPAVSPILLELLAGLTVLSITLRNPKVFHRGRTLAVLIAFGVFLVISPDLFRQKPLWMFAVLFASLFAGARFVTEMKWLSVFCLLVLVTAPALHTRWNQKDIIAHHRNYYGIYWIYDSPSQIRVMVHGKTMHGVQSLDPQMSALPFGYYAVTSPMGELIVGDIFKARRFGAIGLGAGTVAAYARPGVQIDFYELDPEVGDLAEKYFSYLSRKRGPVEIIYGDARVSLDLRPDKIYDFLILDAFSGASTPVHLITEEAMALYRRHLSEGGAIVMHISNRHVDFVPMIAALAGKMGANAAVKSSSSEQMRLASDWVLWTWDTERFRQATADKSWTILDASGRKNIRVWTDDYSSVLSLLKYESLNPLTELSRATKKDLL